MRATGLGQMLRHRDRCCDEEQEDGVHRGAMVVVGALAAHVADGCRCCLSQKVGLPSFA
jgi:hypothetical protein